MASKTSQNYPAWLGEAVFYQVYPQSFADSNGDGIGDLPGLIGKLDYLKSLGVSAIWLNPIFDSPMGDAGYDVRDFLKIAPRYGTNGDARRLFRQAHARGLRVVLDLVAGHTSVEHRWFKQSCRHTRNKYSDYYIWTPNVWTQTPKGRWISGYGERDGNFLTNFFWFQPALNYGYAKPDPARPWQQPVNAPGPRAVRRELHNIMKFWLDAGCDGFRVDMASSLVKEDADGSTIRQLWAEFRGWLERKYPQAVLIAEWCNPKQAIDAGFYVDFMIHSGEPAYNHLFGAWNRICGDAREPHVFFERAGGGDISLFLKNYMEHYQATRGKGFISLPTGNHDFPRLHRGRSNKELRVIHAMLLTMPGVPFIYYGDEIGMDYMENLPSREGSYCNRTGTRTPMQWTPGKNKGFSTAKARDLYLPVDNRRQSPNVDSQEKDPASHLNFVRTLLRLRREYPALGNTADFTPIYAEQGQYPFVYERSDGRRSRLAVAVNPRLKPCSIRLPKLQNAKPLLADGATVERGKLNMEGISFGLFLLE